MFLESHNNNECYLSKTHIYTDVHNFSSCSLTLKKYHTNKGISFSSRFDLGLVLPSCDLALVLCMILPICDVVLHMNQPDYVILELNLDKVLWHTHKYEHSTCLCLIKAAALTSSMTAA